MGHVELSGDKCHFHPRVRAAGLGPQDFGHGNQVTHHFKMGSLSHVITYNPAGHPSSKPKVISKMRIISGIRELSFALETKRLQLCLLLGFVTGSTCVILPQVT